MAHGLHVGGGASPPGRGGAPLPRTPCSLSLQLRLQVRFGFPHTPRVGGFARRFFARRSIRDGRSPSKGQTSHGWNLQLGSFARDSTGNSPPALPHKCIARTCPCLAAQEQLPQELAALLEQKVIFDAIKSKHKATAEEPQICLCSTSLKISRLCNLSCLRHPSRRIAKRRSHVERFLLSSLL